jgi:hypothetical protein
MSNLFRRAAVITDLHWGLKSNSLVHNQDCRDFIDWFIELAQQNGCDTGFFLGDWHNHRANINLQTLQFSVEALEKLSAAFDNFYFIPGNHDLYYRDRRDVHGVVWARHIPNIHIINDWFHEGDVIIAPWLVGNDYKRVPKMSAKYMFGHFELPGYLMNAMIEMPDHGEIKREHFSNFDHVYTGHFHKRQTQGNISYIGNCFPHNYSDVNDDQRGCMILPWGESPEFHAWPNQPCYRVYGLSEVLADSDRLLKPNMYARVMLDVPVSYEEANFVKETLASQYDLRELSLIPNKNHDNEQNFLPSDIKFESVDQIVTGQIINIDSEFYDTKLLLKIYQSL